DSFISKAPVVSTFVSAGTDPATARPAPVASGPILEQRPPENPYSYGNGVLLGALAYDVQPLAAYGLRPGPLPGPDMEASNPAALGPEVPLPDDTPRSGAADDQAMFEALMIRRFRDMSTSPARREHLIDRLF